MIVNYFDKHNWYPEVFSTEKEIKGYLEKNNIYKKRIKKINTIGIASNMSSGYCKYEIRSILADVGVPYEVIDSGEYKLFDSTFLPCEVEICEPVVIVFEDGTTLEMMPIKGRKLQMSINQIHEDLVEGTNRCNYDSVIFFKDLEGTSIDNVNIHAKKIDRRDTIMFQFWQRSDSQVGMYITQSSYEGWFNVGLFVQNHFDEFGNETVQIPYSTKMEAVRDVPQIVIVEGHDVSGYFWIMPIHHVDSTDDNPDGIEECVDEEISIGEDDISHFLSYFLEKYFDEKYDYQNARSNLCNRFEWNLEHNIYTYETMEKMLHEIEEKANLLATNFEDKSLVPIIDRLNYFDFIPLDTEDYYNYTKKEELKTIKENIFIATDFYSRFVRRMRSMMKNSPEYALISFMGP